MKLDRNSKSVRNIEISLGLVVGYLLMSMVDVFFFDKELKAAFLDEKIIMGVAGILLSGFLLLRNR